MLRKTFTTIGICASLLFVPASVFAEKINEYKVHIEVKQNGNLSVMERITYDFEKNVDAHGIYRTIPLTRNGVPLVIKDIRGFEENSSNNTLESTFENNTISLKIGDMYKTISGIHTYVLTYTIERPFVNKKGRENISLPIIGTDWNTPIENASFLVSLPLPLSENEIYIDCKTQYVSEENNCTEPKLSLEKHGLVNAFLIDSLYLKPNQGIHLEVSIPEKSIDSIPFFDKIIGLFREFWSFLIVGILGIIFLIIWHKKGRDIKGSGTIVPEYVVPENLHPLMIAGIIREGRCKKKDLIASIINLCNLGFISIEVKRAKRILNVKKGQDSYILKLEKSYTQASDFDKELLNGFFEEGNRMPGDTVAISHIKNTASLWNTLQKNIQTKLIEEGYFTENLNRFNLAYHFQISKTTNVFLVITIALLIVSTLFGVQTIPLVYNFLYISTSLFLVVGMYIIFIYTYPSKTKKGAYMKEKIQGFKMYLSIAEKHRIHFENPPQVTPEKFSEFLLYAIVLGVEHAWKNAVQLPENYNPVWWHDSNGFYFSSSFVSQDMIHSFGIIENSEQGSSFGSTDGFGGDSGDGGGSW